MNNNEPIIVPLSISAVPMSRAFSWYKNALLLIKAQPLVMFLTSAWIVFAELFLAGVLPIVGTVMFLLISPAIAFGMADLCQKIRLQQPASPLSIFSPLLHSIRNRLLSLGLIFAVVLFALFILSQTFVEQTAMGDILNKIIALQKLDDLEQMRAQSREVFALILQQKKTDTGFWHHARRLNIGTNPTDVLANVRRVAKRRSTASGLALSAHPI